MSRRIPEGCVNRCPNSESRIEFLIPWARGFPAPVRGRATPDILAYNGSLRRASLAANRYR
ncbi:MAG: hypothetical protein ACREXY_00790 [Gammaproteobacteria bacterium]